MQDKLFNELMKSVKEMDAIAKGKQKPSPTFTAREAGINELG